jgi:hypothetical protein
MAAPNPNENQGLKIAVACFVMLSVILAVTTYFGFKSYGEAYKNFKTAEGDAKNERDEHAKIQRYFNDFKDKAGFPKATDEGIPKAITDYRDGVGKKVAASIEECKKAIQQYKEAGGGQAKIDELSASLDSIVGGLNDPAQTLMSQSDRLTELLGNQALISTNLALEFKTTRTILEATNGINAAKLQVATEQTSATKKDLNDEHDKHEQARQSLMAKVDALQSDTNKQAQEIASLKNLLAQQQDDFKKQNSDLRTILASQRDLLDKKDTVLDKKDGTITFVDYTRGEVRTDLTRSTGAREQMILTIFDKNAPGLPSDKPKGTIELIQVNNNGSVARIIETKSSINPMKAGDQVYSASWDPNRPLQYALMGKIDMNRDGRDDRADLKRMIESSGGIVAYDLPPSNVGPETGKLSPRITWYVVDDQIPYHPQNARELRALGSEDEGFLKKRTAAIKIAREDGIRPKPLDRLLNELGYSYNTVTPGRVEAADRKAIEGILRPKGRVGVLPGTDAPEEKKEEPTPEADKPEKP